MLLKEATDSRFATRKWKIFHDQQNANYSVQNEIIYSNKILKSHLFDYHDTYILARSNINVLTAPQTQAAFKNCVPFTKCTTKTNGTAINGAEDVNLVMPMHNLKEYSSSYSDMIRCL